MTGWLVIAAATLVPASALHWEAARNYSDRHGGTAIIISSPAGTESHFRPGWTKNTSVDTASVTKSITALAWLSAFSPSEPISFRGRDRSAAAFLSQSSGLEPGHRWIYTRKVDLSRALQRLRWGDGQSFAYGPSHWEVIGSELHRRGRSVDGFLDRLGIRPAAWTRDVVGSPHHSAGAHLTVSDLLRLGQLVADGGRRGWVRLIPARHLHEALTASPQNPAYGLGFWLNSAAAPESREFDIEESIRFETRPASWKNLCLSRWAPPDLVAMAGSRGQRVYVVPSARLVVVRLGTGRKFRDPDFLRALFRGMSPLPAPR